ncbi:MAG: MBL fold metallo-hydrolase [Chitinophagaceae bacterium]|nr:MBL fold metallo-hydrolase [Chitinophagaceae bacterium]
MNVRVKFLGAASEVTGSKYLLQIDDFNLLIDCGLFQGRKELRLLNWEPFPIPPSEINAVVITHAHLDHTGYLPKLFKEGYDGPVYCTTATADLMNLILMDSAGLQVEEAKYAKKKGYSKHEDPQPLYDIQDVEPIKDKIVGTTFEKPIQITDRIRVCFYNAGHILGAAIVELTLLGNEQTKKIVFSGDLGRPNDPILNPPHIMKQADILFVESTYGDRDVEPTDREDVLDMMNETFERDGNIVVPAFSIGRTQNLLIMLKNLLAKKEIPKVRIFVDSPMAIKATEFYRKHKAYHKLADTDIENDETFLTLRNNLTISRTAEESKKINDFTHDCVIIAGSGMMTGGRILHHLFHRLPDEKNVILITGYQPEGGRGRRLQRGEPTLRIFGQDVPVRAQIFTLNGLSAHADRSELLDWLNGFEHPPKQTFIVHGEKESATALRDTLLEKGWNAHVPHYLENAELFKQI